MFTFTENTTQLVNTAKAIVKLKLTGVPSRCMLCPLTALLKVPLIQWQMIIYQIKQTCIKQN